MGGTDFRNLYIGTKNPKDAFSELVENAIYDYGHSSYSGTIKEKNGFKMLYVPEGDDTQEFINDKTGENDKWGPAYCIELRGEELENIKRSHRMSNEPWGDKVRAYVFFGIASN